eukprot:g8590.t1
MAFQPRDYQLKSLDAVRQKNTIVSLPTGGGKTFVAVLALDRGGEVWRKCLQAHDVLVGTPEVFRRALVDCKFLSPLDFSIIIFDECHNATGNSPMAAIMKDAVWKVQGQQRSSGSEWDYVLLSTVLSSPVSLQEAKLGCLADKHLLNVAVSRARVGLVVLQGNRHWAAFLEHCKDLGGMVQDGDEPALSAEDEPTLQSESADARRVQAAFEKAIRAYQQHQSPQKFYPQPRQRQDMSRFPLGHNQRKTG